MIFEIIIALLIMACSFVFLEIIWTFIDNFTESKHD